MIKITIISVIYILIGFLTGFISAIIATKEMYDKRTNEEL